MIAVAVANVLTDELYFPLPARYLANSCNGALIGVRMTLPDVIAVGQALPAILLVDLSWVAFAVAVGLVVYRLSAFSLPTAMFASAPGGISDMGLIAEDLGGNPTQVTVMQLFRLVCVLTFCPSLLMLLE
jgi:membrane AbrB-like protein